MGKRGQVAESSTLRTEVNGRGPVTLVWGPFSAVTKLFFTAVKGRGMECSHLLPSLKYSRLPPSKAEKRE